MRLRNLLLLPLLALAVGVAACGDDDDDDGGGNGGGQAEQAETSTAAFELSGKGRNAEVSGPSSVEAGAVEVELTNTGDEPAGVTLVRVEGNHTVEEGLRAGNAWGEGEKPLPEWVRFVGGIAAVDPGSTSSSVQELSEGTYAAIDIDSNAYKEFEVSGDGTGELPATDAEITAVDYSFESSGLKAGRNQVLFVNEGKEPHFALAAPIKEGSTFQDVRRALQSDDGGGGPPPIVQRETTETGILDGGESQVVDLELRSGEYVLLCFIPDRKGGPPHVAKGMISQATVE
jgi:hypothetical protein